MQQCPRVDHPHNDRDIIGVVKALTECYVREPGSALAVLAITDDQAAAVKTAAVMTHVLRDKVDVATALWVGADRWTDLATGKSGTLSHQASTRMAAEAAVRGNALPAASRDDLAQALRGDFTAVAALLPAAKEHAESITSPLATAEEKVWITDTIDWFRNHQIPLNDAAAVRMLVGIQNLELRDCAWETITRERRSLGRGKVRHGSPRRREIVVLQPAEFVGSPAPFSGALVNNRRQTLFAAFVRFGQFHETVLYRASGDDLTALQRASSIGDFVWADTDGDGVQDVAEPGIPDVFILLRDSGGIVVRATFSDAQGRYVSGDLPVGDYSLQFFSPSGYRPTGVDLGPDDVDSDADPVTGRTEMVTIVPGRPEESVDAGFVVVPRASIGGVVWVDSNRDGLRDKAVEPGLGGVEVALLDGRGQVLATQLTHEQFGYVFPRLAAGDYRVRFTAPPGFAFTIKDAGGDDQRDSDADPGTGLTDIIGLGASQIDFSVHAGLVPSP